MKKNVTELILDRKKKVMAKPTAPAPAAAKPAANAKPEAAKPTPPPQPPKPKYGVPELAEALGIKATSVRVRLRNAGVAKNGKLYGWDTKPEMLEVIAQLKASAGAKSKTDEA